MCLRTTQHSTGLRRRVRWPPCRPTGTRSGSSATTSPGSSPCELRCGATDVSIGGAGSVRWIALLGRACRRHRQLLSTQGNGGVFHCRSLASISLRSLEGKPFFTARSQRCWSWDLGKHNLHQSRHRTRRFIAVQCAAGRSERWLASARADHRTMEWDDCTTRRRHGAPTAPDNWHG